MTGLHRCLGLLALLLTLSLMVPCPADEPTSADAVKIGMIGSLFKDMPADTVQAMMQPFSALMQAQTGVAGEIVTGGDADSLGELLASDKVQLGVMHGIEYAWMRAKYPTLKPLMIAVNQVRNLRAHVLVSVDSTAANWSDLSGKILVVAAGTRLHCEVYAEQRAREAGKTVQTFFGKVAEATTVEDALDDVVDDIAQVVIVDGVSLDAFKRRKPGRFERLKILQSSEAFPAAVVVYRPGCLADATLTRFKDGMTNANQNVLGRQLLMLWKLTGFEPVPDDYNAIVDAVAKTYPQKAK